MLILSKGRYRARATQSAQELRRAQRLRALAFYGRNGVDSDAFDDRCQHVLIEEVATGALVGCFRLLALSGGAAIADSYSAQFYDLSTLAHFKGPMAEIGRFCLHPAHTDPDILRVAWGALTAHVDANGIAMLFGCSSFPGTDAAPYSDAFALLRDRHLAPTSWHPGIKAAEVYSYATALRQKPDLKRANAVMPPLLKTYLMMGGRVSDHAVVDREMNTLHVFTGLEIAAIPPGRAARLRDMVG
jgi:L-ornithine Nalpha-acyltransferase